MKADMERKKNQQTSRDTDHGSQLLSGESFQLTKKNIILYMTHFNVVLYALCYWIQIGVLPVSFLVILLSSVISSSIARILIKIDMLISKKY